MKTIDTYYIKRNSIYIWLAPNLLPSKNDEVIEIRKMTVSDEGKVLVNNKNEIIGLSIWNKNDEKYIEIDIPIEEPEKIEN